MAQDRSDIPHIAFIGFGEAAEAFVSGWPLGNGPRPAAYDIKTDDPAPRAAKQERYAARDVRGAPDAAGALEGAELVFSVVTADRALEAAMAAAPHLKPGALWFDCNSCAPQTKRAAAAQVEAAGGRYIDVAVMAPVSPKGHRVPLLVAGPHAEAAEEALAALDMCPEGAGAEVGAATSVKMIRSVIIKGLEALTAECFLAARRAGVEERVLGSLAKSDPDIDWVARGAYNLERMMVHGTRRAAEMEEVAATLTDLELPSAMSSATVEWQRRIATLGLAPGDKDLIARADRVLDRL